jgi:hypothetical protein
LYPRYIYNLFRDEQVLQVVDRLEETPTMGIPYENTRIDCQQQQPPRRHHHHQPLRNLKLVLVDDDWGDLIQPKQHQYIQDQ